MDTFINKNLSIEEVWAAEEDYIANGGQILSIDSPFTRWHALKRLDEYQLRYEKGEKFALMLAIGTCAEFKFVMPQWVADAYLDALIPIMKYEKNDWNEVFGDPNPKNTNINAARKKYRLEGLAYLYAREAILRDPKRPIDSGLYEEIGNKLFISKTTVQNYCKSIIRKGCDSLSKVKKNADSPRYQLARKRPQK